MSSLFNRKIEVVFSQGGHIRLFDERFKIVIRISKTLDSTQPDSLELNIFNISPTSRAFIAAEGTLVSVKLGYGETINTVFLGDVMSVAHLHNDAEWVTTVKAGDKGISLQTATMNKTYIGKTKLGDTLKDLATSFDAELEIIGDDKGFAQSALSRGKSYTLDSKQHMDQIAKEHGLDWSIQDGLLIIVKRSGYRLGKPLLLNYTSGLLRSPELDYDDKTKENKLKVLSLMQSQVRPGDQVVVESTALEQGSLAINVKQVVFNASSIEGEFTTAIEGIVL